MPGSTSTVWVLPLTLWVLMGSVLRGVGGDLQGIGDGKCRGQAADAFAVFDACFAFFDVFPMSDAAPEALFPPHEYLLRYHKQTLMQPRQLEQAVHFHFIGLPVTNIQLGYFFL